MTTGIANTTHDDVAVDLDDTPFEFDEEAGPDDELDPDGELDAVDVLDTDDDLDDAEDLDADPLLAGAGADVIEVPVPPVTAAALVEPDADDDVLITDEVEASLDVILAERMRSSDDDDGDDEVEDDDDALPSQLATIIPVRRPEEFLCQSCFLLKPPGQLADADHQLCRDCA